MLSVPLLIGVNWALIILGATIIAASINKNKIILPLLAGFLAVAFDFV